MEIWRSASARLDGGCTRPPALLCDGARGRFSAPRGACRQRRTRRHHISRYFNNLLPRPELLLHSANFCLSFLIITLVFALIFKLVPEVPVAWYDVWIGVTLTSLLFSGGNLLISFYLGWTSAASPYGVAGTIGVVLVWVYYSAQTLFLGAQFTHVYAGIFGSRRRRDQALIADEQKTRRWPGV